MEMLARLGEEYVVITEFPEDEDDLTIGVPNIPLDERCPVEEFEEEPLPSLR
jgi:hypothetical protein